MLPAPRPCGGAAAPAGRPSPSGITKSAPVPPFQETETLKLLPSDSCSPCAKHFLTATNLGLSSIFYRTAPEKSIFFCRTSQFFCRRLRCCICLQQGELRAPERVSFAAPPSRTRRGRRPRRPASCSFAKGIFRAPARHPFAHGGKRMQKRRQKPMVFGIPFIRLQLRCKKVPQRIASAPTLAAADMARREQWSPSRLGDYQIAHLPPAAASVGAARWAAPPSAEHSF